MKKISDETRAKMKATVDSRLRSTSAERVQEGNPYWVMIRNDNDLLIPKQRVEEGFIPMTKGKAIGEDGNVNPIDGMYAEGGNYYHTLEDCQDRCNQLNNK